jgi:hypothetical protein
MIIAKKNIMDKTMVRLWGNKAGSGYALPVKPEIRILQNL